MLCPHCNCDLPEGLTVCFQCGKALHAPAVPAPLPEPIRQEQRPVTNGNTCPHCGNVISEGLAVCFHCGKRIEVAAKPPAPPPANRERAGRRKIDGKKETSQHSGKIAGIVAVLLIFLLGGAAAGHYLGLYELPLLPVIEAVDATQEDRGEPREESDADEAGRKTGPEEEPTATGETLDGFDGFSFVTETRERDSAIIGLAIMFASGWEGELQSSDITDFAMTKDGEDILVSYEEDFGGNEYGPENQKHFFLDFTAALTEPGEYEATVTVKGDTRVGSFVIGAADTNGEAEDAPPPDKDNPSTALTIDADDLPDIEFTVDDVVILETTIDEIWEMYAQFNPDENANGVRTNTISDRGSEITGFHFSDTRDDDGIVDNIGIQDKNMRFKLLGKYTFGEDAPTLFTDFTGLDPKELSAGYHILYDEGGTFLEVKIESNGYFIDYTEGEVRVMISVTDDRIEHFDMRRADIK